MARHEICPSTMTVGNLADWIRSNKVDVINHVEKFPLTPEEINDLQKSSSLASRAIDKLKDTLKYIGELIKNGTPWDPATENNRPVSVTIPPTQGVKVLEANRKFADRQLESGYREDITPIYFLPWPEFKKMVGLDIQGEEWSKYTRKMTDDELMQHGRPILSAAQQFHEGLAESGMRVDRVEDGVVKISTGHKKKKSAIDKQPPLDQDEKDMLRGISGQEEEEKDDDLNL